MGASGPKKTQMTSPVKERVSHMFTEKMVVDLNIAAAVAGRYPRIRLLIRESWASLRGVTEQKDLPVGDGHAEFLLHVVSSRGISGESTCSTGGMNFSQVSLQCAV